jgi:hypothetical protein
MKPFTTFDDLLQQILQENTGKTAEIEKNAYDRKCVEWLRNYAEAMFQPKAGNQMNSYSPMMLYSLPEFENPYVFCAIPARHSYKTSQQMDFYHLGNSTMLQAKITPHNGGVVSYKRYSLSQTAVPIPGPELDWAKNIFCILQKSAKMGKLPNLYGIDLYKPNAAQSLCPEKLSPLVLKK